MNLLIWASLSFFLERQKFCAEKDFEKYWTSVLDKKRTISGKLVRSETCLSVIDYAAGLFTFHCAYRQYTLLSLMTNLRVHTPGYY